MTLLARLRVVWVTTVAFLPLYAASGVVLRDRVAAGAYGTEAPGWLIAAIAVGLGAFALGARPLGRRLRLAYGPACLLAWSGAEGVAICALAAWVGGAPTSVFGAGLGVSGGLLLALWPREAGRVRHDGIGHGHGRG